MSCSHYVWQGYNFYVNSGQIALPVDLLRYVSYGAGSAQGAASRRRPLYPRAPPAKSPLRGTFDLSLQAAGRAEAASLQNTASARIHAGCPLPERLSDFEAASTRRFIAQVGKMSDRQRNGQVRRSRHPAK